MKPAQRIEKRLLRTTAIGGLAVLALLGLISCRKKEPAQPVYHLRGKIVSVNQREGYAVVDHENIPGFMPAMTMPYPVSDPRDLARLSPGDQITADLAVVNDVAELRNIAIVAKAGSSNPPPGK